MTYPERVSLVRKLFKQHFTFDIKLDHISVQDQRKSEPGYRIEVTYTVAETVKFIIITPTAVGYGYYNDDYGKSKINCMVSNGIFHSARTLYDEFITTIKNFDHNGTSSDNTAIVL